MFRILNFYLHSVILKLLPSHLLPRQSVLFFMKFHCIIHFLQLFKVRTTFLIASLAVASLPEAHTFLSSSILSPITETLIALSLYENQTVFRFIQFFCFTKSSSYNFSPGLKPVLILIPCAPITESYFNQVHNLNRPPISSTNNSPLLAITPLCNASLKPLGAS